MLLDNFIKTQRIITQHVAGGSTINEPSKIAVHHRRLVQSFDLTVRHRETWGFRLRIGLSTSCSWISGSSQMKAEGHHLLTRLILHSSPLGFGLSLRLALGILPFVFAFVTLLPFSFALVVSSALRRRRVASTTFAFSFVVFSFPLQGTLAAVVPCPATVPTQAIVTDCVQGTRLTKPGLFLKEPDALNELIPAAAFTVQDNVLSALRIHSLEQNRLAVAEAQTRAALFFDPEMSFSRPRDWSILFSAAACLFYDLQLFFSPAMRPRKRAQSFFQPLCIILSSLFLGPETSCSEPRIFFRTPRHLFLDLRCLFSTSAGETHTQGEMRSKSQIRNSQIRKQKPSKGK